MSKNPFKPSGKIAKKLKVLLWGESGSGKTIAALTFKEAALAEDGRVAYIDTERGTDLYLDIIGDGVDVFRTTDLRQIEEALAFIREDAGKTYKVVVIDSISPVYQTLIEAEMKRIEAAGSSENPYTRANQQIRYLYNDLVSLSVHVVVTAREAEKYTSSGKYFKSAGAKADSSKDVNYPFDFVISMEARTHVGTIDKQRILRKEDRLPETLKIVAWEVFAPIADRLAQGDTLNVEDEREVVNRMAKTQPKPMPAYDPDDMTLTEVAKDFARSCQDAGMAQAQAKEILNVEYFTDWKLGRKAAEATIDGWIKANWKTESANGTA